MVAAPIQAAPVNVSLSGTSIPDKDSLIEALVHSVANLERSNGSKGNAMETSKAARMLGAPAAGRSRSGSVAGGVGDTTAVLEGATALGRSVGLLMAKLYTGGAVAGVRDTLAKTRALDELLVTLYDRPEAGTEWRELNLRFVGGIVKLFVALELHVRNAEAVVPRVQVRKALDEMQGAGHYLKALLNGMLVTSSAERSLLVLNDAMYRMTVATVEQLESKANQTLLADNLSELHLSIRIFSPIVTCKEPSSYLIGHCLKCEELLKRLASSSDLKSLTIVLLNRLVIFVEDLRLTISTAPSSLALKVEKNTLCALKFSDLFEQLTVLLQKSQLTSLKLLLQQVSETCDDFRAGLKMGSKIQSSAWSEIHAHQKRILADAMACERSGRPVLVAQELKAQPDADNVDTLLMGSIRVAASVKGLLEVYLTSEELDNVVLRDAFCSLAVEAQSRIEVWVQMARLIEWLGAVGKALAHLRDATIRQKLFVAMEAGYKAVHDALRARDILEGHQGSAWQSMDPKSRLDELDSVWIGPRDRLLAEVTGFAAVCEKHRTHLPDKVAAMLPVESVEAEYHI